jgi:hypothetical protein
VCHTKCLTSNEMANFGLDNNLSMMHTMLHIRFALFRQVAQKAV